MTAASATRPPAWTTQATTLAAALPSPEARRLLMQALLADGHDESTVRDFIARVADGERFEDAGACADAWDELVARLPAGVELGRDVKIVAHVAMKAAEREARRPSRAEAGKPESQAAALITLGQAADLFTVADGTAFADVVIGTGDERHRETWPIDSPKFRRWLQRRHRDEQGKPASRDAIASAVDALAGDADDGPVREVWTRVGEHEGAVYIDLGDARWRAVKVTRAGWQIVSDPPVRFRRPKGALALPEPTAGAGAAGVARLRRHLHVGEDGFRLVVAWMLGVMAPGGTYAVLEFHGPAGAGKTAATRRVREVIDPSRVPTRAAPREERDFAAVERSGAILAFDNLSHVGGWFSDALARLVSGGGWESRALYSDGEPFQTTAKRPVVMNGIPELAAAPDLLDRSFRVSLVPIGARERRTERELDAAFAADQPAILGGLLDAVSCALRRREEARRPVELPRLADLGEWVEAAAPALGWEPGEFLRLHGRMRADALEVEIESSPATAGVVDYMRGRETWTGTAGGLLAALEDRATEPPPTRGRNGWPSGARGMSGVILRYRDTLRRAGVEVEGPRRANGVRTWTLRRSGEPPASDGGDADGAGGLPF